MEELLDAGPPAPADLARRPRPASAALAGLVEEADGGPGLQTAFEAEGDSSGLAADAQLVTYRIAQEALSNAVQHAEARHVRVRLICTGEHLELRVTDDGDGFDARASTAPAWGSPGCASAPSCRGAAWTSNPSQATGTRVRLRRNADEAEMPMREPCAF